VFLTSFQEEVLFITVNRREWAFLKVHARLSSPVIESVSSCDIEEFEGMADRMIMAFMWLDVRLGAFHTSVRNVRATTGHSIDQFSNAGTILKSHSFSQLFLHLGIWITHGREKLL
jgi:hypothetical protein